MEVIFFAVWFFPHSHFILAYYLSLSFFLDMWTERELFIIRTFFVIPLCFAVKLLLPNEKNKKKENSTVKSIFDLSNT